MNSAYAVAAVAAALTCGIHLIVGGRELVRPLLASRELPRIVVLSHYYCWHLVSIALALIATGLALAAWDPAWRSLGVAATLAAALFGALNLAYALCFRLTPRYLPQWLLFAAIVVPALLA